MDKSEVRGDLDIEFGAYLFEEEKTRVMLMQGQVGIEEVVSG